MLADLSTTLQSLLTSFILLQINKQFSKINNLVYIKWNIRFRAYYVADFRDCHTCPSRILNPKGFISMLTAYVNHNWPDALKILKVAEKLIESSVFKVHKYVHSWKRSQTWFIWNRIGFGQKCELMNWKYTDVVSISETNDAIFAIFVLHQTDCRTARWSFAT